MPYGLFKRLLIMIAAIVLGVSAAQAKLLRILALGTSLTQGYGVPPGEDFTAVLEARLNATGSGSWPESAR